MSQSQTTKAKRVSKTPEEKKEHKQAYMREYKNNEYHEKTEFCKAYGNSIKAKKRHNIDETEWLLYKHHLADIIKLRQVLARLPMDMVQEAVNKYQPASFSQEIS
jgi:hypothetical protein